MKVCVCAVCKNVYEDFKFTVILLLKYSDIAGAYITFNMKTNLKIYNGQQQKWSQRGL